MRRSHAAVLAAVALFALPGCGSTPDSKPSTGGGAKVASLESAAPAPDASKKPERPRERLDTTPEEFEAMLKPYNDCMTEHGVTSGSAKKAAADAVAEPAKSEELEKAEKAHQICEPQYYPLPPWERDPANPEARDFAVEVVKCLKEKGVKFVAVDDDGISIALGGEKNHARSISLGLDQMPECERTVAAAMKD
jgi:hypothetical protein